MVARADMRSLRLASCCRVLVVNGAAGFSVKGLRSTLEARKAAARSRSTSSPAMVSVTWSTELASAASFPVAGSKSLPVATRLPPRDTSRAANSSPLAVAKRASRSQ